LRLGVVGFGGSDGIKDLGDFVDGALSLFFDPFRGVLGESVGSENPWPAPALVTDVALSIFFPPRLGVVGESGGIRDLGLFTDDALSNTLSGRGSGVGGASSCSIDLSLSGEFVLLSFLDPRRFGVRGESPGPKDRPLLLDCAFNNFLDAVRFGVSTDADSPSDSSGGANKVGLFIDFAFDATILAARLGVRGDSECRESVSDSAGKLPKADLSSVLLVDFSDCIALRGVFRGEFPGLASILADFVDDALTSFFGELESWSIISTSLEVSFDEMTCFLLLDLAKSRRCEEPGSETKAASCAKIALRATDSSASVSSSYTSSSTVSLSNIR
jgi:hypothetical protein